MNTNRIDRLGDSMDGSFEKWDPILLNITERRPLFLVYLMEELVHRLVFDTTNDSPRSPLAEALFSWLIHILDSSSWDSYRSFCPTVYIRTACQENPNHWARILGERLQEERVTDTITSQPKIASRLGSPKTGVSTGSSDVPSSVSERLREHGWTLVEKWDSRPLGIASTS